MKDIIPHPTPVEMKANRQKWVDALRSGKYQQTTNCLNNARGHCCLGVLAEVYEQKTGDELPRDKSGFIIGSGLIHTDMYGWALRNVGVWVGLQTDMGCFFNDQKIPIMGYDTQGSLAKLNDQYRIEFSAIADVIESEPKELFIE